MTKTLVFGASLKSDRYSNLVINRLLNANKEVVAFGIKAGEVNGVTIETEMLPFKNIDTLTLYISPKHQPTYYDYIISLKPRRVIFNPGTENPEFYELLQQNGVEVEAACTLVLLSTNQY